MNNRSTIHLAIAAALPAVLLSGCYVVPIGNDGIDKLVRLMEQQNAGVPPSSSMPFSPGMKPPAPVAAAPIPAPSAAQGASQPPAPVSLPARLYPINDLATEIGMVSGTVTSTMNGKGRFQLAYKGENLIGEATRVSGDDRKGIATAWGPSGAFMTCEYQMSSLIQGAGTCSFSDGARYQVHVGK
jgi:hypothetical protein